MTAGVIETERLSLHELSADVAEDAPFIYRLLNGPDFLKNIGDRGVHSLEEASAYLRKGPMASYLVNGFGLYRVQVKSSGDTVGLCGLVRRITLPDPDLGYALLPGFYGRGYATEAASAVMADARARLRIGCILAITGPRNVASIRALEKVGFHYRNSVRLTPEAEELKLFASTAEG
ncbi:MAG: GNAT family N-acetyltransferase [Pseudoxanthomonas sp.]